MDIWHALPGDMIVVAFSEYSTLDRRDREQEREFQLVNCYLLVYGAGVMEMHKSNDNVGRFSMLL